MSMKAGYIYVLIFVDFPSIYLGIAKNPRDELFTVVLACSH